ncbi:glycosyltransferase family 4 protein [Nodosilinea nodulosa]|uniref:glycosyltransferase family 4 protein n=1 Tax=Nodosilinea nodulosa TaxID=416001 RepID=UPI00030BC057|nr:glycosyltransferase family 1 protein [Nodosilinea nodulosa]
MLSAEIDVAFDCSLLGMGYVNPKARTGIFRAVQQTLLSLLEQSVLRLHLTGLNNEPSLWNQASAKLYLQEQQVDLDRAELALDSAWDSYLKYPILAQKALLEKFRLFEVFRKAVVAVQLPVDRAASFSDRHLSNLEGYQVYHSPYFPLPAKLKESKIPRILTMYDLTPILYPNLCSKRTLQQFCRILESIDIDRDWIVCISEATKQDFCDYTGMNPSRVFTAPLAASGRFRPISASEETHKTLRYYGLADSPYLLSLATLEPRKNLEFLVRCFLNLIQENPSTDLKLVLVGVSGWKNEGIFREVQTCSDLADRVIFTGFLPDRDLSTIYSGALAFAYPSLYEGFGLPPLEAMQCGTPVITSNKSSLPEVVGDAGIMVNPADEDAMCQAILDLVSSSTLRRSLSQKGLARAKQFSWTRCARETVKVYETAISSQDRS